MAATATARKPKAATRRRAPARKPARRPQHTPIPGRLVPLAVGRTAIAIGGLADSGVVLRLTRGRLWIGALAALLVGIVALNVMALSLNASSSKSAGASDGLKRQNSSLRAQLAEGLSSDKVQAAAAALGLIVPEAGAIRYLRPDSDDAAAAAQRLRSGELRPAEYVAPVLDEAATLPATTDPATAEPAPESEAPAAEAPAPTAPGTTVTGGGAGGVASP